MVDSSTVNVNFCGLIIDLSITNVNPCELKQLILYDNINAGFK